MQNKKFELYRALILPSAIGVVFYTFASAMVIILNQFSFIQQYLQIPGNVSFMRMFLDWLDGFTNHMLGQAHTEVIVVGLFWALVGLVVYLFLHGLAHFISDLSDDLETQHYLWPGASARSRAIHDAIARAVFRLFAFVMFVIVALVLTPAEIKGPAGAASVPHFALWFIALWATLHLAVISLRMVMLKTRLFG